MSSSNQFTIGRALYALILIPVAILQVALEKSEAAELAAMASLLVIVVIGVMRLRSIGYSGWWIILAIVPIVNIVLGYRLFAYPPGYAHSKTSDVAMKIVTWIYGIFLLLLVAAVLMPVFMK